MLTNWFLQNNGDDTNMFTNIYFEICTNGHLMLETIWNPNKRNHLKSEQKHLCCTVAIWIPNKSVILMVQTCPVLKWSDIQVVVCLLFYYYYYFQVRSITNKNNPFQGSAFYERAKLTSAIYVTDGKVCMNGTSSMPKSVLRYSVDKVKQESESEVWKSTVYLVQRFKSPIKVFRVS